MSHYNEHPAQLHRLDAVPETLYVITPVFNPQRYRTRWKHYLNFQRHVLESGAHLVTIEATFGHRKEVIVKEVSPQHMVIHVTVTQEMWIKENLINVAIQHLLQRHPDAKYFATVDADMEFARPDWVGETIQQLQHYPVIQMYSELIYLTPDWEKHMEVISFMEGWRRGIPLTTAKGKIKDQTFYKQKEVKDEYGKQFGWTGAPGGAWAYTREALNALGGLLDFAILGSADHYMALGLFGLVEHILRKDFNPEYTQRILDWQNNAVKKLDRNVGYIKGLLLHHWHGKLANRKYGNRNDILALHQYNPRTDIHRDLQGIYQLTGNKWRLRDDMRSYFNIRNEDSTDL